MGMPGSKIYLIRVIDTSHVRYYKIEISLTLFGEIILERTYGNVTYKKHTGKITHFLDTISEAQAHFKRICHEKIKKGYHTKDSLWM